jgi:hypothetical protein
MRKETFTSVELIVPVYLNQKLVFDLVAMSQGGIATVTKVSESMANSEHKTGRTSASFGLSDAFSTLLKIKLSGEKSKASGSDSSLNTSEERVHTPNSLFFNLRNWLIQEKKLKNYEDEMPKPGDFIEFEASLRRSPIIVGLDAITKLMELSEVFSTPSQPKKGQKQKPSEVVVLAKQLSSLSESLKEGGSRDLIADNINNKYKAVLTVEEQFLNDRTMSDIVDGTFKVVGKVIRVVGHDQDSINLLRKTPLAHAPEIMKNFIKAFKDLDENTFSMPEMQTEVKGPAIQVLPISIFS